MTWLRNGVPQPDTGFTVGDINYPAGWIANNSQSERAKLNITLAAEPNPHDQRFSWGWKSDGTENWKDLTKLKEIWTEKQTETANQTLSRSDWMVVKATEVTSFTVPTAWTSYRSKVREACNNRQTEINAASTSEALKALIISPSTVTQNKKDSDGEDIEIKQNDGTSFNPKRYEQETVSNNDNLNGKYPWPDAPTS
jgi:hypothetical protein